MPDPKIYSCTEWGARSVTRVFPKGTAQGIVVHNTEGANRAPGSDTAAEKQKAFEMARRIQDHHMDDNEWADTGQHFTISRGGLILEGRHGALAAARQGKVVSGAHACGVGTYNRQWFGIEVEGDNRAEDKVTPAQWSALVELCAWLAHWGSFDSSKIVPHLAVKPDCTDCPGKFKSRIPELREAVHQRKLALLGPTSLILTGKMSHFGGPEDMGVAAWEGLALVSDSNLASVAEYFLPTQPAGTTGLARRLNPNTHYIACRWDYLKTPRSFLLGTLVTVKNPANGKSLTAKPVDWGPNDSTGRVADLSPSLERELGLNTDDICIVTIPLPTA
jgi:hypothetical protein